MHDGSERDAGPPVVLDLTSTLAGAYCARLLTASGHAVVRVEPPTGHPLRSWSAGGTPVGDGEMGPLFAWLSGGVERLCADPADPDERAAVLAHAERADAVLWTPDSAVTLDELTAAAPRTTVTAISPFGLTGPWAARPATELTLQALSGGPALRGARAWPPLTVGGQHGEYMAGVFAAVATLVGLRRAVSTGQRGGVIDVSSLEAVIMTQLFNPHTMLTQAGGVAASRPKATVADVVRSKDGWVGFAVVNRVQHWHDFCAMIGRPDWAEDRSLDPVTGRTNRCEELNPVIDTWVGERTTAEVVELASLMRIPCVEIGHGASIPELDGGALRRFFERNPGLGFLQPAAPFTLHPPIDGVGQVRPASPTATPIRAVPRRARPARPEPWSDALPFAGLRVADFTSFWAGPFLTHTLAMFGADVIHVESTVRPDGSRLMTQHPASVPQWWERSSCFHGTNTNKRGLTLDLSQDEGRALARRLVGACDVVVENYSPRVMDSWGLSWDDVRSLRPDAVMVRMPAFGLSGPWRDRTGFAMTMEQVSGMAWMCGFPEHAPAALFGPCDPSAGLHALVGLLAALEHRRTTGEGRLVEAPMVAGALHVAAELVIEHSATGVRLDRDGNRGPAAAPQNCYPAADVDAHGGARWIALAVATDEQWQALRRVLGDPHWAADPALAAPAGRRAHHELLDREIGAWCAARPAEEIVRALSDAGVPAERVLLPADHLDLAQLLHRRFFEHVEHPVHGDSVHTTFPFRLPGWEGPVHRRPAPLLGQDNATILGDLLGVSDDELRGLEARRVIGTAL